jgi:adenine-specific DNA-methyltransferase
MPAQVDEWHSLGMVDEGFKPIETLRKDKLFDPMHSKYQFLPLDTRYFKDLELDILALFDDLDAALDGWLVHSENYQALNTLLPKFKERVDVVYIDPPFNTAASEIIYQNKYKHSSWLSLMDERIRKAKGFMKDDSIICTAIDDFEAPFIGQCLSSIFDETLHLATVVVRSNPHGRAMAAGFSQNHEFAFFYGKTNKAAVGRLPRGEKQKARYPEKDNISSFSWMNFRATGANSRRSDRPKLFYPIFVGKNGDIRISAMQWLNGQLEPQETQRRDETIILPVDADGSERVWNLGWERAKEEAKDILQAKLIDGKWQIYRKYRPNEDGMLPGTWWDHAKYSATESGTRIIKDLLGERELFSYPKSVFLVEDCLRAANCAPATLVLDFFAGSGTTAHAVMNLNRADGGQRKYILVEMGEHFNTVILPRVKKVAFSDKWKEGKANDGQGMSQFVKYYDLEQYEDTLRHARYESTDTPLFQMTDVYSSYVFLRDLKLLDAVSLDKTADRIEVRPEKLYNGIDLTETLSCITGKWIKRITKDAVEFEDGSSASLSDPDWSLVKPLIWW